MSAGADVAGQRPYGVRQCWGLAGLTAVAPGARTVVVVDVLSFTTAVDVATAAGVRVRPAPWSGERGRQLAAELGATLAVGRRQVSAEHPYSLSPATLAAAPAGTRLVLPSPNGATICDAARRPGVTVLAACLRNAAAVADAAGRAGFPVAVVAAGERWEDGSLRPALEDLLGAGAVVAALGGPDPSPEARAAAAAYAACDPAADVTDSASGRELVAAGFADDVAVACAVGASTVAPTMDGEGFFEPAPSGGG